MDPLIGGAIISGLFGIGGARRAEKREAAAIAAQNAYNDPSAVRARAEKAGVNPLLFMGPGVGQQTAVGGTDYMSGALANAGMMLGDAFASSGKASTASKLNQYQQQNDKLRDQVQRLTLRPKVGGIYAGNETAPTRGEALGSAGRNPSLAPSGPDPLGTARSQRGGSVDVVSTRSAFGSPGSDATTEVPEGADVEDIGMGLVLEGINAAKSDGNLPRNVEQPFYDFGRNVSYGLAVAADRVHNFVYDTVHGTRVRDADATNEELWSKYWLEKNPQFLLRNGGADFRKFLKTAPKLRVQ